MSSLKFFKLKVTTVGTNTILDEFDKFKFLYFAQNRSKSMTTFFTTMCGNFK